MMVGGLAAGAAIRTFPFRVYSFPSEIVEEPSYLDLIGEEMAQFKMTSWENSFAFYLGSFSKAQLEKLTANILTARILDSPVTNH